MRRAIIKLAEWIGAGLTAPEIADVPVGIERPGIQEPDASGLAALAIRRDRSERRTR